MKDALWDTKTLGYNVSTVRRKEPLSRLLKKANPEQSGDAKLLVPIAVSHGLRPFKLE